MTKQQLYAKGVFRIKEHSRKQGPCDASVWEHLLVGWIRFTLDRVALFFGSTFFQLYIIVQFFIFYWIKCTWTSSKTIRKWSHVQYLVNKPPPHNKLHPHVIWPEQEPLKTHPNISRVHLKSPLSLTEAMWTCGGKLIPPAGFTKAIYTWHDRNQTPPSHLHLTLLLWSCWTWGVGVKGRMSGLGEESRSVCSSESKGTGWAERKELLLIPAATRNQSLCVPAGQRSNGPFRTFTTYSMQKRLNPKHGA